MARRRWAGGRFREKTMWCSTVGFIVTLTMSMLAAPLTAVAQPAGKVPKIGFLMPSSATSYAWQFEAFTQGLRALGYIEGQNIVIEQRYAGSRSSGCPRWPPNSPPSP